MGKDGLGEFEQVVLLTVWRLGDGAYGATIRRELQERSGRRRSISAIYVTLMRLEKKGLVQSTLADPTPVRGGKAKRLFNVAPGGSISDEQIRGLVAYIRSLADPPYTGGS